MNKKTNHKKNLAKPQKSLFKIWDFFISKNLPKILVFALLFVSCGEMNSEVSPDSEDGPTDPNPHKVSEATFDEDCQGSTGENPMPSGYCDPRVASISASNQEIENSKLEYLRDNPIGKGNTNGYYDLRFEDVPIILQLCKNWCGAAATQLVLKILGVEKSQREVARGVKVGSCDVGEGTCLTDILFYLNRHLNNNFFSATRIGHDTPRNEERLIDRLIMNLQDLHRPMIALINQTPLKEDYRFPGFTQQDYDPKRAHYITIIGYKGAYNGSNSSAELIFRDSSGRNNDRETVDLNILVYDLMSNDGKGSCSGKAGWNLIW